MKKSSVIYNFAISQQQGKILLTAQEYPWSVLQVITFEPQYFDKVVALCKRRGMVATHDKDRSFCIIHLCSGNLYHRCHGWQHLFVICEDRHFTANK